MSKNYGSQLKGWGVDRAITFFKDREAKTEDVIKFAEELVKFCWVEEESIEDLRKQLEAAEYDQKVAAAEAMVPATGFVKAVQ